MPKSKCTRRRYRTLPVVGAARPWYQATRRFDLLSVFYNCLRSKRNCYKPLTLVKVPRPASQQQQQHQKEQHIHGISAEPLSLHATRLEINVERKCAENYNNWHDKFIFKTAVSIVVISNYNSFKCCLIKLLPYILFEKYIHILAKEMASPGNQHSADCIGTLSFPIGLVLYAAPWCFRRKYYWSLFQPNQHTAWMDTWHKPCRGVVLKKKWGTPETRLRQRFFLTI